MAKLEIKSDNRKQNMLLPPLGELDFEGCLKLEYLEASENEQIGFAD